jgi:ComF family protein
MALVKKKTKTILSSAAVLSAMQAGFSALMDALVPPSCPICRAFLQKQDGICGPCWQDLNFITGPVCQITGHPMPIDLGAQTISLAAQMRPPPYHRARAAFAYDGSAAELIRRFKFRDRPDLATYFAPHMLHFGADVLSPDSLFVPVPLHRWRLLARRFNQSAELVRALHELTGHDMSLTALRRVRATRRQLGLTRAGRKRNLRGAFAVPAKYRPEIEGRSVVLVDDVLTTGATVEECSRVLRRAGAAQVDVLTIARVVMPEQLILS